MTLYNLARQLLSFKAHGGRAGALSPEALNPSPS